MCFNDANIVLLNKIVITIVIHFFRGTKVLLKFVKTTKLRNYLRSFHSMTNVRKLLSI